MLLPFPVLALATALGLLTGPATPPTSPLVPTVLSGHLDHAPPGDTVRLTYAGHYRNPAKAVLSPAGDFRLELKDLKTSIPAVLSYARQQTSVYLRPGDQLRLTLDFARFDETLRYTGRGADANNYLAQSLWKFEYGPTRPQDQLTAATTPAQMRQHADAFRQQRLAFLATYAAAHPLPPAFRRDAALDIDLQWAISLLEYPDAHAYKVQQAATQPGQPAAPAATSSSYQVQQQAGLPASYFDFVPLLPLKTIGTYAKEDRGLTENTLVLRFLAAYSRRLVPSGVLSTDPAEAGRLFAQATADFGPTYARDFAMYLLLIWKMEKNLAGVVAAYPTFRVQNRDSTFGRELRQLLRKQLLMQPGMPAPAFSLLDNTGKQVSLSDFRGKVVYLDFWGTWCQPCLEEMPVSSALRKQFAGRDVVFIYISVGDKEEKWQQVLAAKHLLDPTSVHLRSDGAEVPTDYQVQYYPSYRLIGRDGRIRLSPAPRPSDGAATVAAIEGALRE